MYVSRIIPSNISALILTSPCQPDCTIAHKETMILFLTEISADCLVFALFVFEQLGKALFADQQLQRARMKVFVTS